MSADDRTEMSEEMEEFWARVKDRLPGLLGQDGFVSALPLGGPDDVDIFTVWWSGTEEHIASLYRVALPPGDGKEEPRFDLLIDEPGTDGRTITDVSPRQVADVIEKRAADQVRAHLSGAWFTGPYFEWDESIIAAFSDVGCEAANMGEFFEYVQREADKALARRAFTTTIDLLLCEEAPFTTASIPQYWMNNINLPDRTIKIRTDCGIARATLSTLEGEILGSVDITMGSRGVSYPFCAMEDLIYEATRRGR